MKMISKGFTAMAFALTFAAAAAFADEKGTAVMQAALDVEKPKFSKSMVEMKLKDLKSGDEEVRQIMEYGRNYDDGSGHKVTDMVMLFQSPANIKDTRFLQKENYGKDDDKWIYLPALKNTRRVNTSEGSKAFVGSDASYDDMSTREIDEDDHQYQGVEEKNVRGTTYTCDKVKEVPHDKKNSQYSYRITWVDQATHVPVYTEMYDKDGKLEKTLEVPVIVNYKGYTITKEAYLTNVQKKHSTALIIKKLAVDEAIPDRVFTADFLKTGK